MINIREYLEQVRLTKGYDAMDDKEKELYELWETTLMLLKNFVKTKVSI